MRIYRSDRWFVEPSWYPDVVSDVKNRHLAINISTTKVCIQIFSYAELLTAGHWDTSGVFRLHRI
jgi:hypothetical protein